MISDVPAHVERALVEESLSREPMWHGSDRELTELRPDAPGHTEYGIYVSPRRRYASRYGKYLYAVRVHTTTPLYVDGKHEVSPRNLTRGDVLRLKQRGYDSIVVGSSLAGASEVVLFDPEQAEIIYKASP